MALLKKVTASSLMETLVATVLIVIIFMISSMVLNNIIANTIKHNTDHVEARLNQLEYAYRNDAFQLPYQEDFEAWDISFTKDIIAKQEVVVMQAVNSNAEITLTKSMIRED